jgi:DNA polymerase-3 subunit epsilon
MDGTGASGPQVLDWLADPGVEIPDEAARIHGITTEKARAEGRPLDEVVAEVAWELMATAGERVPVVAFNAMFDFTLLDRETRRHGLDPFGPAMDAAALVVIDPFVMDKAVDAYRKGPRNLTAVAAHYGVKQDTAHSAIGDAVTAARVAWKIAQRYPEVARMTHADLMAWQAVERRKQARSLAGHFRKTGKPQPVDEAWPWSPPAVEGVAS